jgi:hypothetical protein
MADNNTRIILSAKDEASDTLGRVGISLGNLQTAAAGAAASMAAVAPTAVIAGLAAVAKSSIDTADAMRDMSSRISVSITDLASYTLIAEQSGTSLETVGKGIRALSKYMVENGDALRRAGITAKDANGAFGQLADLFSKLPEGTERTALAMQLLGKAGADLIPILIQGGQGLDDSRSKAAAYAKALEGLAPKADEFNDQLSELSLNLKAAGMNATQYFMPGLIGGAQLLNDLAKGGKDAREALEWMGVGGGAFGALYTSADTAYTALLQLSRFTVGDYRGMQTAGQQFVDRQMAYWDPEGYKAKQDQIASRTSSSRIRGVSAPTSGPDPEVEAAKKRAAELLRADEEAKKRATAAAAAKSAALAAAKAEMARELALGEARVNMAKSLSKALDDAGKDAAQAAIDGLDAISPFNAALDERIARIQTDTIELGGNAEQIREHTILVALQASGLREGSAAWDDYGDRMRTALKENAAAKIAKDAAADAAKEWQKFSDDIERALTDSLMRAFENGDDFGTAFVNSLKNTLKTTVLKVAVQAIVDPITGAISGAGGAAGGSLWQSIGTAGTVWSAAAGTGAFISGAANLVGSSSLGAFGAGMGMTAAEAAAASSAYAGAGMGATGSAIGAGQTVGAAMPYIAAAAIAYKIAESMGVFGDAGTPHVGGMAQYSAQGGLQTGRNATGLLYDFNLNNFNANLQESAANMAKGITTLLDTTARTFQQQAGFMVGTGFADDSSGDGSWGALQISRGGASMIDWRRGADNWPGREFADGADGQAQYTGAVAQAVKDTLLQMDLPNWARDMIAQLNESITIESLGAVVDEVNALAAAAARLGPIFTSISAAIPELAIAAGGIDKLSGLLGSYYEAVYSEEEKRALLTKQVQAEFTRLNLTMPQSIAGFRALVEAQDVATESGRSAYLSLLSVAEAFSQITGAVVGIDATRVRESLMAISSSIEAMRQRAAAAGVGVANAQKDISAAYLQSQRNVAEAHLRLVDATRRSIDSLRSMSTSLRDYIDTVVGRTSGAGYDYLRDKLQITALAASGGDAASQQKLPQLADAFLKAAEGRSGTEAAFARDVAFVTRTLGDVIKANDQAVADLIKQTPEASTAATDEQIALMLRQSAQNATATNAQIATLVETMRATYAAPKTEIEQAFADFTTAYNDSLRYQQLAIETGASMVTSTDIVADEIRGLRAAYNTAALEQTLANGRLEAAITGLAAFGLTPSQLTILINGVDDSAQSYFAQLWDVPVDTIEILQAALGLSDEALQLLADAVEVAVSPIVLDMLAASLGVPDEVIDALGTALGISSVLLDSLATSLGWDADAVTALGYALGWDTEGLADLATSLGWDPDEVAGLATALGWDADQVADLATALGWDPNEVADLATALGWDADQVEDLATALGWDDIAVDALGTALGWDLDAADALGTALGYDANSIDDLADALGVSDATSNALGRILGYDTTKMSRLSTILGISDTALGTLGRSLGWDPAAISTLKTALGINVADAAVISGLGTVIGINPAAKTFLEGLNHLIDVTITNRTITEAPPVVTNPDPMPPGLSSAAQLQWKNRGPALAYARSLADTGDYLSIYNGARDSGLTLQDVDILAGLPIGSAARWARDNGLPTFAAGGYHSGGFRMVGENGPELEATGPAKIWSFADTQRLLAGGSNNPALMQELLDEIKGLRNEQRVGDSANVAATNSVLRFFRDVSDDGTAIYTRAAE